MLSFIKVQSDAHKNKQELYKCYKLGNYVRKCNLCGWCMMHLDHTICIVISRIILE